MIKENMPNLASYCRRRIGDRTLVFHHYMSNKIDKFFVVFLIRYGYFTIDDDERPLMPYITEHYRDILEKMKETNGFIEKIKEKLDGRF